jgi:predicted CXXCH cytochrome family protein
MKKVLVLAVLAALVATSASALSIKGTKHDLSTLGGQAIQGTSNEVCVYCHTPHGAASVGFAPLWNRNIANATNFYNNPAGSINATMSLAGVNASDAPLCLSCHDGASLTASLNNPPNAGGGNPAANLGATAATNLGTDLSNDHPIGFVWSTASADAEINSAQTALPVDFGSSNDQMWCSSCHNVHDNATVPFLNISNSASALCLTCHIK